MNLVRRIRELPIKQKIMLAGLLWVCIAVSFVIVTSNRNQNKVSISGINNVTAPASRKEALSKALYNVLKSNLPSDKNISINDAAIREGTYIDNYDNLTNIHNASFIVDIKSIKQSYLAYYEWSNNDQNPNLSGYPVTIQCLPKDLLVYGDFNCKPMGISDNTNSSDTITRYLPYHVESKYNITSAAVDSNGNVKLTVEAYMPGWMTTMTPDLLSSYTDEIKGWITSKGLDPNKYTLDYQY